MNTLRTLTRSLVTAGRLGWAIESNWTDPFVFMIYQIVRPLFGALILVFMFKVVTGQPTSDIAFAQLYVGNAFFILVVQSVASIGQLVFELREHYEMIKYIYLAPIGLGVYLTGHGLSKVLSTAAAVAMTLLVGYLVFGISYHFTLGGIALITIEMILGIVAMMAFGIILAAVTMVTAHHGFSMAEGAAGIMFLLCGVVFSIDILPDWVATIGRMIPLTYWLEGLRRALLGTPFIESLSHLSDTQILWRLSWSTAITVALAWLALTGAERLALATGKLDQKTDH